MPEQAQKGDTVRVHYTGRLADGQVFDSSEGGEPLEFKLGTGQVIPGFEEAVIGMRVGEEKRVEIDPEDAYGPRRDGLVTSLSREVARFPEEPKVGDSFLLPLQDGTQHPVTVTEVTDTHVTIDGNHPLAGQKLIFDVELIEKQ